MTPGKVTCLLSTHGRYTVLCRALACFLAQDYPNRELLILNHHPKPLDFNHPLVTVFNAEREHTLGSALNFLLPMAAGEFVQLWSDDDLFLPWHLSQGVANIGSQAAWKPSRSWFMDGCDGERAALTANNMEPSILWRTEHVREHGFDEGHHECASLLRSLPEGIPQADMGYRSSFVFIWGFGGWHMSGSDGSGQTVEERNRIWRQHNQDTGDGKPLAPADASGWWQWISWSVPELERAAWLDDALRKN